MVEPALSKKRQNHWATNVIPIFQSIQVTVNVFEMAQNSQLKNLAERLLQQDIKDHEGASGSLFYNLLGGRDGRDSVDHDLLHRLIRNGVCVCKIGKIKAKFQGGSAGLCLFFFRILVKFMRNSLEEQAAEVVKKMLKDEEDMAVIGLIALFAFSEDQLPEEPPRRGIGRYIASCAPGTRTRH
ncbi:Hypothetical predicted protein [Mytilus galloprovincialis]|uniref:Uncharacterized protein n=1 Tax=Mytilus galloprovincialis TaxID=29158 RepID=A0A8B6HR75_MYTGA|nr:Hypothetical predicted protein [Mytilus galloprovincialis]